MSNKTDPVRVKLPGELKKLRAVCIFTGGAAHDFNNALTAVMGNISLAKLEADGNMELTELLRDAEKASGRIREMTERLSLYARGIRLNKRRSSIADIVRETAALTLKTYPGKYDLITREELPDVEIDPELISEALAELIENSSEAAPGDDGRVEISIGLDEVTGSSEFQNQTSVAGNYIRISVRDNGPGFNIDEKGRLLDPFYSTKLDREGFGLALSYAIIKRHRGFIDASLSEDGGSVFSLYIPLF